MITIVSIRAAHGPVVYIGRAMGSRAGSPLGNPFPLQGEGSRQAVIGQFRGWLWEQLRKQPRGPAAQELVRLTDRHLAGEDLALACWCAPKACHGDVIAKAILWLASQPDRLQALRSP